MAAKKAGTSNEQKKLKEKLEKAKDDLKIVKDENKSLKSRIKTLEKNNISFSKKDAQPKAITIHGTFNLHHTLHGWASSKKVPAADRERVIMEALQIGLLAKMEAKVSQTLKMFKDEVQSEMALIQSYMETFEYNFRKDPETKTKLEEVVKDKIEVYALERGYADSFINTGAAAEKGTSKKGDVVARIKEENMTENMVVEVKFASNYSIGDRRNISEKGLRSENKNVIEQILGSRANRDSEYCIFVIDDELNPLGGIVGEENPILFLPQVKGFIVQVKVEEGKYMPLCVCYEMARSLTLSDHNIDFELDMLNFILKDLSETMNRQNSIKQAGSEIIGQLESSHTANMEIIRKIIVDFERELEATKKAINRTMEILDEFFKTGTMDAEAQRKMYLKEVENPIYLAAQNEAREWTEAISNRHDKQRKLGQIQSETEDIHLGEDSDNSKNSSTQKNPESMTVAELKELLKAAGKPVSGKKADLIARLNE